MATAYKVLGQSNPAANTQTTLYTVPASTQCISSTIAICNQGISTTYRIAVSVAGAAANSRQYIAYDAPIGGRDTIFLTVGMTLGATDVVRVTANTANVSFNLFGSEIA